MKSYLEKKNNENMKLYEQMRALRDSEIEKKGENVELFTNVVCELSYRIAQEPDRDMSGKLCPKCECPIPKADYDNYCGFCGQFIRK